MTDLGETIHSLPIEVIKNMNVMQIADAKRQYDEFLDAFKKGCCYLCGMKLSYFNVSEQCLHWFLLPDGIRKNHFNNYLKNPIGFIQLEAYLRWIANTDEYLKNINDLKNDNPHGKLIETTIKYQNIEWSLNFGQTDLEGHLDTKNSAFPHFHLQILRDGRPFIGFNDYHIPFSKNDLLVFQNKDNVEKINLFGEGISVLQDEAMMKIIEKNTTSCKLAEDATFNTQTLIELLEGDALTLDEIEILYQEAKDKGILFRSYIKEKIPNAKSHSQFQQGLGVIKKKKRS